MKTIKLFLLLLITSFTFSCEKDEIQNDIVQPEPFNYQLNLNGIVTYGDNPNGERTVYIPLEAVAPSDANSVQVQLKQNGSNIGQRIDLMNQNGQIYTRSNNDFGILQVDGISGLIIAELIVNNVIILDSAGNALSQSFNIEWGDEETPITKGIHLASVTVEPQFRTNYTNQTNDGIEELSVQLFQGSNPVGSSFIMNVGPTTNGFSNMINGTIPPAGTYDVRYTNIDSSEDPFFFLDENGIVIMNTSTGQPATSRTLQLIVPETPDEDEVVRVTNSFNNTTAMGFEAIMEISKNFSDSQNITIQLLDPTGSIINSDVYPITEGGGNQTFNTVFPTIDSGVILNPSTLYTIQWVFNGIVFYEATHPTSSAGAFGVNAVISTITSNSGVVQLITTNTTGSDVSAVLKFSGINIEGNSINSETPIMINNGYINQINYITADGYKQNSNVTYSLEINGTEVSTASGNFNTISNDHSNESFILLNSGIVASNQTNIAIGNISFDASGDAYTEDFILRLENMPVGWDPNDHIDNVKIASSSTIDVTWVNVSGGWEIIFPRIRNISGDATNNYAIGFGGEIFTPTGGVGTTDSVDLSVTVVDDIGNTINVGTITLTFTE